MGHKSQTHTCRPRPSSSAGSKAGGLRMRCFRTLPKIAHLLLVSRWWQWHSEPKHILYILSPASLEAQSGLSGNHKNNRLSFGDVLFCFRGYPHQQGPEIVCCACCRVAEWVVLFYCYTVRLLRCAR
jgi:hypothetical protein